MVGRAVADVFISYSKSHRAVTEKLAAELEAKGLTVWWDTALVSGESYRKVILAELDKARAVIVIWTAASVDSDWVITEATRARARGILIPVRDSNVDPEDIPPPFGVLHTDIVSNRQAILLALAKLGVTPPAPPPPKPSEPPKPPEPPPVALSDAAVSEYLALAHWDAVKGTTDPSKLREFLSEFGAAKTARLARAKLGELEAAAWMRLRNNRTTPALRGFLSDFPDGANAEAARAELTNLQSAEAASAKAAEAKLAERRQAEEARAFATATRSDAVAEVESFLAAYPAGHLAEEARALHAKLLERDAAYARTKGSDDPAVLKAFLDAYPECRQAADVRRQLRRLEPGKLRQRLRRAALIGAPILAAAVLALWQWPNIVAFVSDAPVKTAQDEPPAPVRPKIADRVESGPAAPAPQAQPSVAEAQKVVLFDEDPADPNGKRFVGSVIWRTETVTPGSGLPPDLAVRADVEVPERKLAMRWSLRRNTDKALPASHTVEIMFTLPADFPGGGISNVPGILMKQAEATRGTPLVGLAVKVTNNFFLIGLSTTDADMQRNLQLLKERAWFDIPLVYNNNRRAILAMEKGTPGDRAFADAFKAWKQ
jgi:hypothetical protein